MSEYRYGKKKARTSAEYVRAAFNTACTDKIAEEVRKMRTDIDFLSDQLEEIEALSESVRSQIWAIDESISELESLV